MQYFDRSRREVRERLNWLALFSIMFAVSLPSENVQAQNTTGEAVRPAASGVTLPRTHPYLSDLEGRVNAFLTSLSDVERARLHFEFDDVRRTGGRNTGPLQNFCAALAWCQAWGIGLCELSDQQRVMVHEVLATALSGSGYQTARTVLNRNHLMGALEDAGDYGYVGEVIDQCPTLEVSSIHHVPAHCEPPGATEPTAVIIGGNEMPSEDGGYETSWQLDSSSHGVAVRDQQACEFALSVFGEPGGIENPWGLRFEGHHLSINITITPVDDNHSVLNASPLILGSFPVVSPPSLTPEDTSNVLTRHQSQLLMWNSMVHAVGFINALPEGFATATWISPDAYPQTPPLVQKVPPPWMVTGFTAMADARPSSKKTTRLDTLDETGRWHLSELYNRFFATMPTLLGRHYASRLAETLSGEDAVISVAWAGTPPPTSGEPIYLQIIVDDLLMELKADNQWSVQHEAAPVANHLHSVFRDLNFAWAK